MLRAQLEAALGERVHSPFTDLQTRVWQRVSTGIASLDEATGGLPRGAITEIIGGPSSGKTGIALSALAAATSRGEICALVDGGDAFDPASGASSGIDLQRLLWVRCHTLDQTLRSADMLLQAGGFGLAVVDLSDLPRSAISNTPLAVWFRLQRTIENTPTTLLLLGGDSIAKSAAALVLRASVKQTDWTGPIHGPAHATLFTGNRIQVDIARARNSPNPKFLSNHVRFHSCS